MLLQQESVQMNNILAEQHVNNKKQDQTTLIQQKLSSPQSKVLKTYDF